MGYKSPLVSDSFKESIYRLRANRIARVVSVRKHMLPVPTDPFERFQKQKDLGGERDFMITCVSSSTV